MANQTPSCLYQFHCRPRRDSPLRHVSAMRGGALEIGEGRGRRASATSSLATAAAAEGASGEGGKGVYLTSWRHFFRFCIFLRSEGEFRGRI
jgi:hypothetical protein